MLRIAACLALACLTATISGPCFSADPPPRLLMPDGQLVSQPVRVFVTPNISANQEPRLYLLGKEDAGKKPEKSGDFISPYDMIEHQRWEREENGQKTSLVGALLFFDLSNYEPIRQKAMKRVTPILHWKTEAANPVWNEKQVGKEVNLGNGKMVLLYTLAVVAAVVAFILWISKTAKGSPIYLITGADGYLSLSRTQMALWTVAIGTVVFGFGLFQHQVPEIPDALLALMGLSLATTGISYAKVSKPPAPESGNAILPQAPAPPVTPHLADLVSVSRTSSPAKDLSIAKAQMLFWTGLLLVLFLAKSILDGVLWEIPWELVVLMGMSQAGYLGPKFVDKPPA
ncbi:MAG: hypothetical protein K9L59_02270 [Desulfobacterales bacterium]|nr:hypothetical protein [Desulfobacterales bacterium]